MAGRGLLMTVMARDHTETTTLRRTYEACGTTGGRAHWLPAIASSQQVPHHRAAG